MELLASCTVERVATFGGRLSVLDEEGRELKVSLNVVISEFDSLPTSYANVKCLTVTSDDIDGSLESVPVPVFYECSLGEEIPSGYENVLVRLPEGYCDMRRVKELCRKYPNVRVVGGNLLNIEGVRIGRFDGNKPIVCNGVYDTFIEAGIDDLAGIREKVKKVKSVEVKEKKAREKGTKAPAEKKISKKVVAFSNMFGGSEDEF